MATVMHMSWRGVTPEQYDEARERVRWEEDPAEGAYLHVACFDDDGIRVTDVWESPEHFQRFAESRLMHQLREIGIEGDPEIQFHPLHRTFVVEGAPV